MYDIVVIGAGWAGFNASIKAKKLGAKVCLIEKSKIGGTCLNCGCIPTKALIQSAKIYSLAKKSSIFGVDLTNCSFNFAKIQERKNKIVQQLTQGMQFMLQGIDLLNGEAQLLSPERIKVNEKIIETKKLIIATGSKPMELPIFKFDGKNVLSSDDLLNLNEIPASLLIIGGGVIGCEFASLFNNLGVKVTLVEKMPFLLPEEDAEIAKKLETIFKKKGIKVCTNTDAKDLDLKGISKILVCVGRTPDTYGLGLEELGIKMQKGKVIINDYLQTSNPKVFACGDCTGKIMLAHYASYQGILAASNAVTEGNLQKADNTTVPNCIFTDPEIASVGLKEAEAKEKKIEINIDRFDFLGNGMARILDETEGFIKIISHKQSKEILGSSLIGPRSTELIGILALAISNHFTTANLKNIIFAHPTVSEAIHDAIK
ncbi:MAG: dihydrolipoyl dehydrogenase [Candidatus Omnitrophica bacterium]|nr:dihydrolipoyl dehydrogenase [Candidatus Omnitrophota bacterium]